MSSDDGVADGQTQSQAFLAIGIFRRKIRIEYHRYIFRRNADARISQGQFDEVSGGQRQTIIRRDVDIFSPNESVEKVTLRKALSSVSRLCPILSDLIIGSA